MKILISKCLISLSALLLLGFLVSLRQPVWAQCSPNISLSVTPSDSFTANGQSVRFTVSLSDSNNCGEKDNLTLSVSSSNGPGEGNLRITSSAGWSGGGGTYTNFAFPRSSGLSWDFFGTVQSVCGDPGVMWVGIRVEEDLTDQRTPIAQVQVFGEIGITLTNNSGSDKSYDFFVPKAANVTTETNIFIANGTGTGPSRNFYVNCNNPPFEVYWRVSGEASWRLAQVVTNVTNGCHAQVYITDTGTGQPGPKPQPSPPPGATPPPPGPGPTPGAFDLTGVTAQCSTSGARIDFSWSQSDNATSYELYWRTDGGDPRALASPNATTTATSYSNDTFSRGFRVNFDIKAVNANGGTWTTNGWYFVDTPSTCGEQRHTLTVSVLGPGRGTVTSIPAGINCSNIAGGPSDCDELYDEGRLVTLTAKADANSDFGSWTGDACNGSTFLTCSLTMNGPKNVTATFNLKAAPLATPTNLQVSAPSCADGPYQSRVTFRWDNASDGTWWLDIATWDMRVLNTFGGHIQLPKGALSTPPPAGYTLNPDTDYFWRIWPGRDPHVYPEKPVYYPFKVSSCPKGTLNLNGFPGSDCTGTPPKYYVDLTWSDTAPPGGSHYYVFWRGQTGGGTVIVFQGASPPNPVRDNNVSPNTTYTYQLQDQIDGRLSKPPINVGTLACVTNKPDLTVTIDSFTPAPPARINPNQQVRVTGRVTNIGQAATPQGQGFFVWFFNDQAAEPGCAENRDGSVFVSSLAASGSPGDSQPFTYTFNAPPPPGTKTFWAFADGGCNIEESNETNNTASRGYTVGAVATPPPPGIMDVTLTVNGLKAVAVPAGSTVTLAWVTSVSPRPQACVGFSVPSNDEWAGSKDRNGGSKQLAVSVNTTFSITCVLGNKSDTDSVQVIVTAQPLGIGSCTIVPAAANAGQSTIFTWTVTDSLQSGSGSATYSLNWGDFGAPTLLASPWQKVNSFNQAHTYSAGGVYAPSATIFGPPAAVPATRGPFFCGTVGVTAGGGAWFETQAGDVGSGGVISLKTAPPAGKYQSTYLLAGDDLTNVKVAPGGWSVRGLRGPLVPVGGVYNFLAARFKQEAVKNGHAACTISAGALPEKKKFGYCSADAEFSAGNAPNGDQVWFIDGNLTIKKDLKLGAKDTITFIVRGNITIAAAVTQTDGIYVAGGTFVSSDTGGVNKQLVVNGAVLAQVLNLNRILADKNCGVSPCDNSVHPAERVVYDPKYLVGLNSVLGSPQVAWREVAP